MPHIKFGTDGWRGVIAEDFTFANVQKVALATGLYFKNHPNVKNGMVIGYDARFLSKEFAHASAQVIASVGVKVLLSEKISPTQMVSLGVVKKKAAGGVVITASHNPAKYNGFKIKGDFGGPAHPEMIAEVEKELAPLQDAVTLPVDIKPFDELVKHKLIQFIDLTKMYVSDLESKIEFDLIKTVRVKMMHDAMHGAGMGIPELLLPKIGTIRSDYNPSFGTTNPEPLPQNVEELSVEVRSGKYHMGFATDGDADRVGAVDEKGNFVDSHRIFAILLKYLVERKHIRGAVAKSLSVSELIPKMCEKYNIRLYETPVGFKHLCKLMTEKDIIIAGEESGGIAVKGHLPERDGIFIGFLLGEVMATRRKKLSELVKELFDEFGEHHFGRIDKHLTQSEKENVMKFFNAKPKKVGSFEITKYNMTDGVKLNTKNGWMLIRASGTEPLIRFYAEADSPKRVQQMLKAATTV
ncbi:MAG: phosphoglucomutase/phosphomannomutase family protein [Ignavibacteriales bacterium]|nr:phosphoglucomutase/phosphomannomutase family protein [Ignavibacteriales bacterium]